MATFFIMCLTTNCTLYAFKYYTISDGSLCL